LIGTPGFPSSESGSSSLPPPPPPPLSLGIGTGLFFFLISFFTSCLGISSGTGYASGCLISSTGSTICCSGSTIYCSGSTICCSGSTICCSSSESLTNLFIKFYISSGTSSAPALSTSYSGSYLSPIEFIASLYNLS